MSNSPLRLTAAPLPALQQPVTPDGDPRFEDRAPLGAPEPGPGGAGHSGSPDQPPPSAPAPGGAGPATPPPSAADAARRSFYEHFFGQDELSLIAGMARNPTPEDELWLQRVVNRRLLAAVPPLTARPAQEPDAPAPGPGVLVKVAHALNAGAGRVAALLREVRSLDNASFETAAQAAQAAARDRSPAHRWEGRP